MPVDSQHKDYTASLQTWQLVRDCNEGASAIKSRSFGGNDGNEVSLNGRRGTAYLPAPNATDVSDENIERYLAYLTRASFVNFTAHTKEGMLGMVFRKATSVELSQEIMYLKGNSNGGGLSVDQSIKFATSEALMLGRVGLLVDYPATESGLTQAQVSARNLRANILTYNAESIINWRNEIVDGVNKLAMVVLREPTEKQDDEDEFKYITVMYHRVLLLKGGVYVQNIYDENNNLITYATNGIDENNEVLLTGDIIPLKGDGSTWDEIPFIFVGSVNNDETVDKSPLYDIADINIAHYRNSADYEESCFLVGQPTLVATGLNASWVETVLGGKITLGSRGAILLPEGASASLLQAEANQMPFEGMAKKESEMIAVGARIIQDQGGAETAEAARIRFAGQNSKLGSLIGNVESAFIICFEWADMFMSGQGGSEIKINREFYDATIDPQMIIAMIQLRDRGLVADDDIRDTLRKGNLIRDDRTNEQIEGEAEESVMDEVE